MSFSRLLLPLAAATSIFTLSSTSWLPGWLAGSSALLNSGKRAQLLLTSIAALSSALTLHLAVGVLSKWDVGQAVYSSDDAASNAASDDGDKDKDKDSTAPEDGKRWLKKDEVWSETDDDWVPRKTKEESDDDLEAKKRTLFVVKHRTMPKQPNSKGHIVIEYTNSEHIVAVLRSIITNSEELQEDDPKSDDKDLFLAKPKIAEALAALKDEKERRKDEDTSAEGKPSDPDVESKPSEASDSTAVTTNDPNAEDDDDESEKPMAYVDLVQRIDHLEVLLEFINEHFAAIQAKLDRLLPKGMISFKLLWCVIKPGTIVKVTHKPSGEAYACMVKNSYYYSTLTGEQFYMSGEYLDWAGHDRYIRLDTSDSIPSFAGLNKLSSLAFSPVNDTDRARLIERGRTFAKYSGVHYMSFVGALITPGQRPGTWTKTKADGRVMIDKSGFRKMNPSQDIWDAQEDDYDDYSDDYNREQNKTSTSQGAIARSDHVPAELSELSLDLHFLLLPPTVFGFSLALKEWGEMLVDSFQEIKFDTDAYEHLELDHDHKSLIRALVDASREDRKEQLISDVVAGKGGGIIVTMHGPPGTGKTLTAEAVAELQQRPLYVVAAGELGIDAFHLERRLRETLEIARVWRAVVLIDEADIFLEARSLSEISRNSMVGVFLRVLEYQQGILFLTTNRVKNFDEAFLSRFSLGIRYPNLDQARRKSVWVKFLALAGCDVEGQTPEHSVANGGAEQSNGSLVPAKAFISKKDLNRFSQEPLNGRTIKQTVRTAQALAISGSEPLQSKHIEQILRINKRFAEDFESAAPDYQVASESWQNRTGLYH